LFYKECSLFSIVILAKNHIEVDFFSQINFSN
jgi:hypothetical protein